MVKLRWVNDELITFHQVQKSYEGGDLIISHQHCLIIHFDQGDTKACIYDMD